MVRHVQGLGSRVDIDRTKSAFARCDRLSLVQIRKRICSCKFRLNWRFTLGYRERRSALVADSNSPNFSRAGCDIPKVHGIRCSKPAFAGLNAKLSDRRRSGAGSHQNVFLSAVAPNLEDVNVIVDFIGLEVQRNRQRLPGCNYCSHFGEVARGEKFPNFIVSHIHVRIRLDIVRVTEPGQI